MKNKSSYKALLILMLVYSNNGCKKFVTVDPPITQLVTSSVFENDQTATAAMNGIYSFMESDAGFSNGGNTSIGFLGGLSADELTNYSSFPEPIQFYQNAISKNNTVLYSSLWQQPYQCIYDANAVLEGLAGSTGVSSGIKQELNGEARFIRAFCNFYLTNLFGDIPLINTTDYKTNALAFRTSRSAVYQQIITDLTEAQGMLAPDYSFSNGERVKPNAWAAAALLARAYLYTGDWKDAEAEATMIINQSSLFGLSSDLNQVFLKNSPEAIWQLMPNIPGNNTLEGTVYILTSPPAYAALSPQLVDAFEAGDLRKENWIADTTFDLTTYYYAFKYKVKESSDLSEYSMVLRLAEQYLIRAEARTYLNNPAGAASDINTIRNRAGLGNITVTDQPGLLKAIQQERQVELFTEWGHRWLDLIRTGQATAILGPIKTDWQASDTLYPIPQGEIQRDPNLIQNSGY
jgi:starch-binding outer membrane protein, SusD/RagB family